MFKKIVLLILLSLPSIMLSQRGITVKSVLKKTELYYKNKNEYNYTAVYKFFESKTSTKPLEVSYGSILRLNNVSYQMKDQTESFNFGDNAMVIDNKNKTIYLSSILPQESVFNFESYLNNFPDMRIINHYKYWICEMKVSKNILSQYHTVRFYIDKKNYALYKQTFFMKLSQQVKDKKQTINLENPRLEIILRENASNDFKSKEIVNKDNYFTVNHGKIVLSKKYKNYKLIKN